MSFDRFKAVILQIGRRLGRPDILFWTLPWLMFLIIIGTIIQKSIGLYEAQNTYFSAFVFFWNGIPLPAGHTVLGIMMLNLSCKFIFLSTWTKAKIGIHIIHLSIMVLLVGGLMTSITMSEGYISLKNGEQSSSILDYHNRQLSFTNKDRASINIPFDEINNHSFSSLPFTVDILQSCINSAIQPRNNRNEASNDGIGAAKMAQLVCIKPNSQNERNVSSLSYRVTNADTHENGTYIVFEGRQTTDQIMGYNVILDRQSRDIPFSINLHSFNRDVYPGTNMPRGYESRVKIIDADIIWPAIISMNNPLRYRGYTFYQASTFVNQDGQPVSVLNVVENKGWIFPYISGILLAFGLIYHIIFRMRASK